MFSCEKENEKLKTENITTIYQFEATVLNKGGDCGDIFIIELKNITGDTDITNGTYYADNLDSKYKESGLQLNLNCRKPKDNEAVACIMMAATYPHIIVTSSKKK